MKPTAFGPLTLGTARGASSAGGANPAPIQRGVLCLSMVKAGSKMKLCAYGELVKIQTPEPQSIPTELESWGLGLESAR